MDNNYRTILGGDIYLTSLSVAGVISRSFGLLLSNFFLIYKVVFVSYIPTVVIAVLCKLFFPGVFNFALDTQSQFFAFLKTFLSPAIISYLITAAVNGVAVKIVSDTYAGLEIEFDKVLNVIKKCIVPIFIASALQLLVPLLLVALICLVFASVSQLLIAPAFIFIVVLAMYFMVSLSLYNAAIVVEGKGVIGSLERSWHLTDGYRPEMLCTVIAVVVLFEFVYISCGIVMLEIGPENSIVYFIVGSIPGYVFLPYVRIIETVVYFNLRVKKENLTRTELMSELQKGDNEGRAIYEIVDLKEECA